MNGGKIMEGKVKIIVFLNFFFLFLICDNSQYLFKANQIRIKCYKPVLLKCFALCLRNCLVVTNFIFLLALQDVLEVQCGIIQHNENLLWNSFLMLFNNLNEQPNVSVIIILKLKAKSVWTGSIRHISLGFTCRFYP